MALVRILVVLIMLAHLVLVEHIKAKRWLQVAMLVHLDHIQILVQVHVHFVNQANIQVQVLLLVILAQMVPIRQAKVP